MTVGAVEEELVSVPDGPGYADSLFSAGFPHS